MDSKNELKKNNIKIGACYYFEDIIRYIDVDFRDIFSGAKSYKTQEGILVYDISYKTSMGSIPLSIRLDRIDGLFKIYDRFRYLVSFDYRWCDKD